MTPAEALAAMQGTSPGLTTYQLSPEPELYETHQACEYLEAGGQARRYLEHYVYAPGAAVVGQEVRYVIWVAVAGAPALVPPAAWPPPPPPHIPPPPEPDPDPEAAAADAPASPPPA